MRLISEAGVTKPSSMSIAFDMNNLNLSSILATNTIPVYLDCAATAPIEPAVLDEMIRVWTEEPGNSGSRTHHYGVRAKRIVQSAREKVAKVVCVKPEEVLFTSGATESNNIAILGIADYGINCKRRHIISTAIEHKAVLEPLQILEKQGFEISLIHPETSGAISGEAIQKALRPDTLLVSVMQVNNETGICQPVIDITEVLEGHDAYFHVDAAQGFGKELESLRSSRIDMISISAHKIFGPMGVGALVVRKRGHEKPPIKPIQYGGGQESSFRPGTLPVALIAGLGLAAQLSLQDHSHRRKLCMDIRVEAINALDPIGVNIIGETNLAVPHILNFAVEGIDSEALMVALKDRVAVSNGSACTSQNYETSHVLKAMNISESVQNSAVRFSWSHLTPQVDWEDIAKQINLLS